MFVFFRFFVVAVTVLFLQVGCYNTPIRHLASDVSLIKVGESKSEDVILYLGEPDVQRMVSEELVEWIYLEEKLSDLQGMPFLGRFFSANGYEKVVVTLKDELVYDCRFSAYEKDEFDWSDDFPWQKKRQ